MTPSYVYYDILRLYESLRRLSALISGRVQTTSLQHARLCKALLYLPCSWYYCYYASVDTGRIDPS